MFWKYSVLKSRQSSPGDHRLNMPEIDMFLGLTFSQLLILILLSHFLYVSVFWCPKTKHRFDFSWFFQSIRSLPVVLKYANQEPFLWNWPYYLFCSLWIKFSEAYDILQGKKHKLSKKGKAIIKWRPSTVDKLLLFPKVEDSMGLCEFLPGGTLILL